MVRTAFDDDPGYRDWLNDATHHDGPPGTGIHERDGNLLFVHEPTGMVTIAGDTETGSTAWLADVLEAGRPGAERTWSEQ